MSLNCKRKNKVVPVYATKGNGKSVRLRLFLTSALEWMSNQVHASANLSWENENCKTRL